MSSLELDGYEIHRGILPETDLAALRSEADRLASASGTTCVRHLRQKSALFADLPHDPRLLRLLPPGLSPVRSILFDKTPAENWPVPWHQDLTITVQREVSLEDHGPWSVKDGIPHVQPPVALLQQMATIRIHLDPTPIDNGPLKIIPRSHRLGKIPSDKVSEYADSSELICPCAAGDILIMSPLILHSSRRSTNPRRRRVLHFEYAPTTQLHPHLNWHEP